MRNTQLLMALIATGFASGAYATNGMNLEGYGPIAAGMGGASMAYDNGNAAVMNNPSTLSLGLDGSRLDVALGFLGPRTRATAGGAVSESTGDAYYMPAIGWTKKAGPLSYGVAMFAQGGMGTDYDATSFLAVGSGSPVRSELGVGRLIAPLSYQVNSDLTVGGSIDYVWAMLDIRMAATGAQLGGLVTGSSGTLGAALPGLAAAPWARFDFSDGNDFTGKARGFGWAGKLGFTYKVSPTVRIGGSYHSKTALGDLETPTGGANISASGGFTDSGKVTVQDFQWPETYALGVSIQATPDLMVAADIKHIGWADVMKSFKMTYTSSGTGPAGMCGVATVCAGTVSVALPQNWEDQTVYQVGLSYKLSDAFTLRAGFNYSDNPIPNTDLNALFPAIITTHYTAGFGWTPSKTDMVNAAFIYTPAERGGPSSGGVSASLGGYSWQLMYSKQF